MATILRAYNDNGDKYDLDVFNEQQFLLDISAIESGDIGKVFGISSQTFALPPTPNNNEYFANLYDLGATLPSGSLANPASSPSSFTKTQPCQVLNDGIAIFNGRLYLDSIITNQQGDTIYNVNVVNETIDFKYQIQDLTFGDLDWSEYNHNYTLTNITSSWSNNLFSGNIVYPLVEYGSEKNDTTASQIKSGGGVNTFTNEDSPLGVDDFKPAIRLRAVMDKVFDTLDYKYTSSLFESSYMDSVYMLSTKDTSKGTAFVNPIQQAFKAETSTQFNASSTGSIIQANAELYDNAGNYDTITYEFRAGEDGQYSFDVSLEGLLTGISFPQNPRTAWIEMRVNGSSAGIPDVWYNLKGTANNTTKTFNANFANITLQSGDGVKFYVWYETEAGETSFLTINAGSYIQCYQSPLTQIGGNVNLKGIFEENVSVIEWLNGVIQKFNLVIEPLADNPKVLSIETFNDWVDNGSVVDWTNKVDRSIKWEVKHPMSGNPHSVYFSDEEDKDASNQYSIEQLGKTFGSKTYISDSDLADGEKNIGTFFAPTPMKYIEGTTDFIIPRIYTNKEGRKERFIFKPRLLHFVGIKNATSLRGVDRTGASTQNEYYVRDENQIIQTFSTYPVFHHVSDLPSTDASKDLHFSNPNHWEYHQSYVNARTYHDAFYDYWAFYINELYDIDARLLTCNVVLKPTEIPTIALNDKIFIDGHYYRINKINGANLTNEQSTKVELIKSLPRKSHFPRRRIFDDIGGYDDVYLPDDALNFTGGVVYNDWNTGDTITGSVSEKAGYRDGLFVYSGSVNLGSGKQPIEPNDNVVLGNNFLDDRVNGVFVAGGGNQVQGDVSDSIVVGSSNVLSDGAKGVNLFGDNITANRNVGSTFIVNTTTSSIDIPSGSQNIVAFNPQSPITPADNGKTIIGNAVVQGVIESQYQVITGSAGGTEYLTGSAQAPLYLFSWTGANGTQTNYLEDANLIDGASIRFVADSTLNGSTIMNIAGSGSQTINGAPEYPLTSSYASVDIQAIDGNWYIISQNV